MQFRRTFGIGAIIAVSVALPLSAQWPATEKIDLDAIYRIKDDRRDLSACSGHAAKEVLAGLVERTVEGRVHHFRLRQKPLQDAGGWIARHQAFWTGAVEQLDRLLSEVPSDDR